MIATNEIQTTLNLLFKEHERGLYAQDFAKVTEFPGADLSHAYTASWLEY
jgi:hypothetical protein